MNAKDTIKNNFSRYAEYYDSYAGIQNHIGSKLSSTLHTNHFTKIIDIGCGTYIGAEVHYYLGKMFVQEWWAN